jgi:hypothetical protein
LPAHTIGNHDVRAIAYRAAINEGLAVLTWHTDYFFKQPDQREQIDCRVIDGKGKSKRVTAHFEPDQFISLNQESRRIDLLIEYDRATESLSVFQKKVAGYVAYFKSDRYQERFGHPSFRVLTVVESLSPARLNSLLSHTALQQKIGQRFWFVQRDDVTPNTFFREPIWTIAGDRSQAAILS